MLRSLNSGVSGLQQFQQRMDVIGNNIANVNTTGFKAAAVNFAETFSQTLRGGGNSSMQVGTGVTTASIKNNFGQGGTTTTGIATNLAVNGNGFFMVRDVLSGDTYATRDGTFGLDSNGYLVNEQGFRVQGFTDAALATRGDIQIDTTVAKLKSLGIGIDGKITVQLEGETAGTVRGQVLLQNFQNPEALVKDGNNLYSVTTAAGGLPQIEAASTNGLGSVQSCVLETSNVDLTTEFADLITTQRAFQANSRIITTSDEMLQDVINLKR